MPAPLRRASAYTVPSVTVVSIRATRAAGAGPAPVATPTVTKAPATIVSVSGVPLSLAVIDSTLGFSDDRRAR